MKKADLVLHNAQVITCDPARPFAAGVASRGGRILALLDGGYKEYADSKTKVVNCRGKPVIPGLIDAHCHPVGYAESLVNPDLRTPSVRSIADIQERIRSAAAASLPGKWIRARGYHEFYLAEKRHPDRHDLDAVSLNNPVKLTHRSGHAHVLNSLALALAGISADTPEPLGGIIDRDPATGEPNGILYEMSAFLAAVVPPMDESELDNAIRLASQSLLSMGITSVQDASAVNGISRWRDYRRWKEKGIFLPAVTMMTGVEATVSNQHEEFRNTLEGITLRRGAVKILLGEAAGKLNPSQGELDETVMGLHRAGFPVAIHAVGETQVAAAANAIEKAIMCHPRKGHRHRIEHCSVCRPDTARKLASLGIIVVTQPAFIYYSGGRYLDTVPPDQVPHLYPAGTFLEAGITAAAGSDCPVVPPDPFKGIYSAVNRLEEAGRTVAPGQAVSVRKALEMYTRNASYSSFEENDSGVIRTGMRADLVMLSEDIMAVSTGEIKNITAETTILGGQIVYPTSGLLLVKMRGY